MAEGNGTQRDIGRLDADVMNLKSDIDELKGDVKQILAKLNEDKGMFRALGWAGTGIAAAAGAVGGVIAKKLGLPLLIALTLLPLQAEAHSWMPESMRYCCNDKDCLPHPREAVERIPGGWVIKATGQVFQDGSPDVHPNVRPDLSPVWICHPSWMAQARCIMVSPEGS